MVRDNLLIMWLKSPFGWIAAVLLLGMVTIISASYNIRIQENHALDMVTERGRNLFQIIELTRNWNAGHGGVYVPITKHTQPNPYLKDPRRDITSTDGLRLTKINPAYMTRQISELSAKDGVIFHITSLKPIRPQNRADAWERSALEQFENGVMELSQFMADAEHPVFRYMAPLKVKAGCMKCHRQQGYEIGDIRGGISVNIDSEGILAHLALEKKNLIVIHTIFFLLIFILGVIFFRKNQRHIFDLTALTEELEKKNLRLAAANRAKSEFIANISHELRTPLHAILNFAQMGALKTGSAPEVILKEYFTNIDTSAKRLFILITNLLDVSELDMEHMHFNFKQHDLKSVVDEILHSKKSEITEKSLTVAWASYPSVTIAQFDKNRILQVINYLLANAIQFTPEGRKITISMSESELAPQEPKGGTTPAISLSLSDEGVGMPEDELESIFELFEQSSRTNTGTGGAGLGLSICKGIIKCHGGTIVAANNSVGGAIFTITLPRKIVVSRESIYG